MKWLFIWAMDRLQRIRLSDVAEDAGVSPATVSRAFARPELLRPGTLERVRASARRLRYLPDGSARALASGRSMTIGAVVPTLDSAIFSRALQAMQVTLAREGYQLLVASHEYSAATEVEAIRTLVQRGVDGVMLVGADRQAEAGVLLASAGLSVVVTWCEEKAFPSISVDNVRAGALAAEHLIGLGHRRIGVVIGKLDFNDRQRARLDGIRGALERHSLALSDWLVTQQPLTLSGGRSGCATLLELKEPPTAIISGIDLLAIGCIEEAHARRLDVPEVLSIVGIDDLEMSAHVSPSLTTVHLPTARIGELAARSLLAQVRGGEAPRSIQLPIALVERRSSAAPAPRR